jgi:integrase
VISVEWRRIAQRAGLPGVRLHDVRHGFASVLAERGVRTELISKVLGHADEGFTLRTYVHPADNALAEVADGIGDALSG